MEQVLAYRAWAIYASYDAEAPDTADLMILDTKELADRVCAELNKEPRRYNNLAYVEGCEGCKRFKVAPTLIEKPIDAICEFDLAIVRARDGEDGDGDDRS